MTLTAASIAAHPRRLVCFQQQAETLLAAYDGDPRLASTFASQQRWLLGQLALAIYFRRIREVGENGATLARYIDLVQVHKVASRNTADAFIKELHKYGYLRTEPSLHDKRLSFIIPTEVTLEAIAGWVALHLTTLDALDSGARSETYRADPDGLARLQPLIADGLLTLETVRKPAGTFSLFTWLDKGGMVMDRMMVGLGTFEEGAARVSTSVLSVAEMAKWLNLSRTHLTRKLREAETLGSIGWERQRFHSAMWVSADFLREMIEAQAVKLAVIDVAFTQAFGASSAENSTQ